MKKSEGTKMSSTKSVSSTIDGARKEKIKKQLEGTEKTTTPKKKTVHSSSKSKSVKTRKRRKSSKAILRSIPWVTIIVMIVAISALTNIFCSLNRFVSWSLLIVCGVYFVCLGFGVNPKKVRDIIALF